MSKALISHILTAKQNYFSNTFFIRFKAIVKQLCTDLKSTLNCLSGGEQQKIPNHLLTHARVAMIVVRRTGKSCLLDLVVC